MAEKIDIVEILKDKPVGLKFYSNTFGYISFNGVHKDKVYFFSEDTNAHSVKPNGKMYDGGECIIFPSKEMRDWEKFSWKKGDVLVSEDNEHIIFEKFEDDAYTKFRGKYYLSEEYYNKEVFQMETSVFEKATDNDAQTYINNINKCFGGKLNLETLEIEKGTEFKDGDIVVTDAAPYSCYSKCIFILKGDLNTNENSAKSYVFFNINNNRISFDVLDTTIRDRNIHLATEAEKQQLFDALAKKGKAWDAEKKQIVDLKPKCEFKPFDRCIWKIRNCEVSIWQASFVSYVDEYGATPMGVSIDEDLVNLIILPYNDQTKLLVGTTDEWKGGEQ